MKIVHSTDLSYIPASHEDPKNPGVLKRVIATRDELMNGRLMMINWAKLPAGKSFKPHYHEDMEEVYIMLKGEGELTVDDETEKVVPGDRIIIPQNAIHGMRNKGKIDIEYIALGISSEKGGKTVIV